MAAEYSEATVLLKQYARCDDDSPAFRLLTDAAFKGYVNAWVLLGWLRTGRGLRCERSRLGGAVLRRGGEASTAAADTECVGPFRRNVTAYCER